MMIELDGAIGEGGGQILRSALSLSVITQKAFKIKNIRSKRSKPGLLRQHLTAVHAAKAISNAESSGDHISSKVLEFYPNDIQSGEYCFKIGTAGSTSLVFQTILYPLLYTNSQSQIRVEGGTHNAKAPTFDYINEIFLSYLKALGVKVSGHLENYGFYPAGGGVCKFLIEPFSYWKQKQFFLRGKTKKIKIVVLLANLPIGIAQREIDFLSNNLIDYKVDSEIVKLNNISGAANVIQVMIENEYGHEMFVGFGEKRKRAEQVAQELLAEIKSYLESDVLIGPYMADQLLIPMALSGSGSFLTTELSQHTMTNIDIIKKFLPVDIQTYKQENHYKITIEEKSYGKKDD
ncbi:MAG TPA: RNA 3'-terminal phosphate cyclase [Oligoflexia bacterium]|nr:RNA 3'-terminal phosphate cyclase [Oligoflexia bacterium]HMR24160.1 RNA 3'-terminal phosphate cyclase [Oligoflexia bacterium]